jgi:hypothetical protein
VRAGKRRDFCLSLAAFGGADTSMYPANVVQAKFDRAQNK